METNKFLCNKCNKNYTPKWMGLIKRWSRLCGSCQEENLLRMIFKGENLANKSVDDGNN